MIVHRIRSLLCLAAGGVVVCFVGCSGATGPVCVPVKGAVTFRNKPVSEAMVVLHRVGGDVEGHQKPMAYTDTLGQFVLTTHKHNDGAPLGEYVVTVELRAPRVIGEETVRDGQNVLPAKYATPETSGIKYTVVPGDNTIPPIELKQ